MKDGFLYLYTWQAVMWRCQLKQERGLTDGYSLPGAQSDHRHFSQSLWPSLTGGTSSTLFETGLNADVGQAQVN